MYLHITVQVVSITRLESYCAHVGELKNKMKISTPSDSKFNALFSRETVKKFNVCCPRKKI
jgi:hypothetical protein